MFIDGTFKKYELMVCVGPFVETNNWQIWVRVVAADDYADDLHEKGIQNYTAGAGHLETTDGCHSWLVNQVRMELGMKYVRSSTICLHAYTIPFNTKKCLPISISVCSGFLGSSFY